MPMTERDKEEYQLDVDVACRTVVRRGAELLDDMRPGWAEQIELDRLAINNCTECVLGQLFANPAGPQNGFYRGVEAVEEYTGPDEEGHVALPEEYGFDTGPVLNTWTTYKGLRWAWVDEIEERRCLTI